MYFDAKMSRSRAHSPITTILKNSTMVPRTPLRSISANRERGHELSPYFRGQIISLSKIGTAQAKIAHLLNVSQTTVQYTLQQEATRIEGTTLARSGRPPILSEDDKVSIFNIIKRDPFIGYEDIRDQSGFNVCNKTFLRMLKASGYGHYKAKRRPHLNTRVAKLRLDWALARQNWTLEDWRRIIWSDECSVEIGKGKRHKWVFRLNFHNEKWKKEYVDTYANPKISQL
jgi:transposase